MFCPNCGKKIVDTSNFCEYCGNKINVFTKEPSPIGRQKFLFWRTFTYIFIVLLILLSIFFGLVGSYEEGFIEPFIGVLFLSFFLAIISTFIIKWRKDYKTTGKLISEESTEAIDPTIKPGIRDWLLLVVIGLIIQPLVPLYYLFTVYIPIFAEGTWGLITNPNSSNFIPGIGNVIIFEVVFHIVFFCASLFLLALFFTKDKTFPKFYIIYLVSILIYSVIDYALAQSIPSIASQAAENVNFGQNILAAIVWIPYMMKSKLVKATFVNN